MISPKQQLNMGSGFWIRWGRCQHKNAYSNRCVLRKRLLYTEKTYLDSHRFSKSCQSWKRSSCFLSQTSCNSDRRTCSSRTKRCMVFLQLYEALQLTRITALRRRGQGREETRKDGQAPRRPFARERETGSHQPAPHCVLLLDSQAFGDTSPLHIFWKVAYHHH